MSSKPRGVLGMVFLVVFLDMVGFSVIFPLLPSMLEHYLAIEGDASQLGRLIAWFRELAGSSEGAGFAVETLFGGVLGSLYSLLQFLFAPVWGALSDKYGRRPTLLLTLAGTALSYLAWVFAGSFAVLVVARLVGGIMAGNVSTATAVIGDTTSGSERAKGMGIVGMAVGLGFIFGPAIGGIASLYEMAPSGVAAGTLAINPFSACALGALALSLLNLAWVATRFHETLPPEKRGAGTSHSLNPFRVLARLAIPGVPRTGWVYFAYYLGFSAMEFTLTFLAFERFAYSERDNMWMFVFVGVTIALVQGGFVRRLAPRLGEKKLALVGLFLTLPGFLLVAGSSGSGMLYGGLAFLAIGSGFTMPTLSALVSRYSPEDRQGIALGSFRSAGAMARAVGPILGGFLYWRFGSGAPCLSAAVFLAVPILLAIGLPAPPREGPSQGSGARPASAG